MGSDNRGQWQAQGQDIEAQGHSHPWNEERPPSKSDAKSHLDIVTTRCTDQQRALRSVAIGKAQRYIERAPADGIAGFHMKTFLVGSPPLKARRARIDLEITAGHALCDDAKGNT